MSMARTLAALAVSLAVATPAAAALTWNVEGDFTFVGGGEAGSLSGTFTTNDTATLVTALHLTATSEGGFETFTYDNAADVDAQWLPQYFRVSTQVPGSLNQLQLFFGALYGSGDHAYAFTGFEHQDFLEAGNRMLEGTATLVTETGSPTPEPQSWTLLIAGFGLMGASLRRRRILAA